MIKKDTRVLDKLLKDLNTLIKSESETGFYHDNIHPETNEPLSNIAFLNNYGGENADPDRSPIPARPFMEYSLENAEITVSKRMVKGFEYFIEKGDIFKALDLPAEDLQRWIGWTIEMDELYERNAPMTIRKKGGRDEPLTDTGYLAENVERKVKIGR